MEQVVIERTDLHKHPLTLRERLRIRVGATGLPCADILIAQLSGEIVAWLTTGEVRTL